MATQSRDSEMKRLFSISVLLQTDPAFRTHNCIKFYVCCFLGQSLFVTFLTKPCLTQFPRMTVHCEPFCSFCAY